MSQRTFELRGRVIDSSTGRGAPDLRVILADAEDHMPSMLFRAVTDADGEYCVELTQEDAARLFDPSPNDIWTSGTELYASIYNDDVLLLTTNVRFEMHDVAKGRFPNDISVGLSAATSLEFSVYGRLVDTDGNGIAGARINVERIDVANRIFLGFVTSASDGSYEFTYDGVSDSTATETNVALQIYALDVVSGDESVRTPIIVNPDPAHHVDLLVGEVEDYVGRPEYERVSTAIAEHNPQGAPLSADDLEVLIDRTGLPADQVAMAIQAQRIQTARGIPAEAAYALIRGGLPADVPGQLAQSRDSIRRTLQSALDSNLVSDTLANGNPFDVETLVTQYSSEKANAIENGTDSTFRDIVATSGVSTNNTPLFYTRLSEHEGTMDELWEDLRNDPSFTTADVDALEFTVRASELSNGHLALVSALNTERGAGNLASFSDLAAWDESDWSSFVATHGAPTDLPGDQAEREALYAASVARFVEEKLPTQVLARRIERDDAASEIPTFLDANPDFDIESTMVIAFADDNPTAFDGFATDVQERVKAVQRVYGLTPRFHRYAVSQALLDAGIESAAQVVHTGRAAFVASFSSTLDGLHDHLTGEQVAKSVYNAAVQKHAFSVATMAQYGASFNAVSIPAIQVNALQGDEGPGAATLANLFGSLDYCECEHCRSMYGPAAYFVALLSSLEGATYLDEVTSRRADLTALELSCANTNVTLPYIDIVNEVLEQVSLELQVEGNLDNLQLEARQTTWSADELRINPEPTGFSDGALTPYTGPAQAAFPWSLPLDLPAEESRAYLKQLGLSRSKLKDLFDASDATAERLGMTQHEFDLIAGVAAATPASVAAAWGMDGDVLALHDDLRQLLDRARIDYEQLTKLLELRYIRDNQNPERIVFIPTQGETEPSCDLDDRRIDGFTVDTADRMHRFIRLGRVLDMEWVELDKAIASLGGGTINAAFLESLAGMLRVQERLGLESDEACALWNDIDAYPYEDPFPFDPGLYGRLFQSRKVFAEPDPDFAWVSLSGALEEEHYPTLKAALRINDSDLAVMIQREVPVGPEQRTPAVLSQMFRVARLCRALGLSVPDYYRLVDLSGLNAFESAAATLAFADLTEELLDWGVSLVELDYLCRHESVEAYGQAPTAETLEVLGADIRAVHKAAVQSVALTGDPQVVLHTLAAQVAGEEQAEALLALLASAPTGPDAENPLSAAELMVIEQFYEPEPDLTGQPNWSDVAPDDGSPDTRFDDRVAWMVTRVATRLEREARRTGVIELLANETGLPQASVETLASSMLTHTFLVGEEELTLSVLSVLTPDDYETEWDAVLTMFLKVANFVSSLRVEPHDLDWYFSGPFGDHAMDLATVPMTASTSIFDDWNRVRRGQVNAGVFADEHNPVPNFGTGSLTAAQLEEVALSTGWNADDVAYVVDGASLATPTTVERLRDVMAAVRATGVSAATLDAWAASNPADTVSAVKQALRSRYSEAQWPKVIQPISDRLRERRRDALLEYILQESEFSSADEVYEHFLLDPEMNACMLTSRVKLAISSVQLFIQRALLSLEPNVELPPTFEKDWEWKKNYRVWEANRKVFFYPENWIEPELRVGKTPFFEELEAHLQQGNLTTEHVEKGFDAYVTKLHEVANLEVLDLHRTYSPEIGTTIHVIARTRSRPGKYFYRTQVNDAYWTPWEEVEAPIESRQVILRSMGNRLFLMWLEFHDHAHPPDKDDSRTFTFLNYRFSWCERLDAGWSQAKTTDAMQSATTPIPSSTNTRNRHVLWGGVNVSPDSHHTLSVECWYERIPVLLLRYDPCKNEFRSRTRNIPPRPEFTAQLDGSRESIPRRHDIALYRTHPETSSRLAIPIIENTTHSADITYAHQNGVWTVQPDGTYPAVVDIGRSNIFCVPTSGSSEYVLPPPPPPPEGYQPQPDGNQFEFAATTPGEDTALEAFEPLALQLDAASGQEYLSLVDSTQGAADTLLQSWHPAWRFDAFQHPYTCPMLNALRSGSGAETLLAPSSGVLWRQQTSRAAVPGRAPGQTENRLTDFVVGPVITDEFDFSGRGTYSVYNWEVFYHAPMLIADRYRREGDFEEADRWYRYIFDPRIGTVVDNDDQPVTGPERFWRVKPLYNETRDGEVDVIQAIFSNEGLDAHPDVVHDFVSSVFRWAMSPFDPHAIAAVRSGTYRWVAVRKYLDNLIEWGDSLFRRDTIESINEASQLYLLASAILGRRPERLSELEPTTSTYNELSGAGLFGGLVELEGVHPSNGGNSPFDSLADEIGPETPPLWWYFCLPTNPQLLEYWDTIDDRLFKIRNCQNIEGVTRQLALFQPPIDPALLVRARAAGLDLGNVLNDLNAAMPHYRYRTLVGRSIDLCNDLKSLGGALLTTLEKKDAEELAQLRAAHETAVLRRVTQIRKQQVEEAAAQVETLQASQEVARHRRIYYASRERVSTSEKKSIDLNRHAGRMYLTQQGISIASAIVGLLPDFRAGTGFFAVLGGETGLRVLNAAADALGAAASHVDRQAQAASVKAGHNRRWDDWVFQAGSAALEEANIEKQIIAAEIRKAIAEKELENHERQIEQAKEVQAFYKDKFTNKELYDWMIGEISRLYFQAYKLAFDMAKKAERAMQFELETEDTFIDFGYWDSLKKGLMSGERLHLDIKRMESAYLEKDKRELELTKRISLRQIAPEALQELRETGECNFSIPEVLFDLDHAGHYLRRMRAVRVTIPAVAGPQTSIGATLTLLRDDLRTEPSVDEAAIRTTYGGTKRIATSHAREDGGLFELNFRDERYLPFEGGGVASEWSLRLPTAVRQFDYNTITDVEVRIDYTARDGGGPFRTAVESELQAGLQAALENGVAMVFSAKKDFAVDWERVLRPAEGQLNTLMEIPLVTENLPYMFRGMVATVQSVDVVLVSNDEAVSFGDATATFNSPGGGEANLSGGERVLSTDLTDLTDLTITQEPWALDLGAALPSDDPEAIDDLWVVVRFSVT